ncbi:uncharacterized protein LOC124412786 [Diprion similis]|uniref:uncharacterized protein LOC124412786 n=1 Tax=Diprion similis TaxID=362088 RepID=UPI001EF933AC|nr:uncharacterized protein LOC124412786 [Diprion similis]
MFLWLYLVRLKYISGCCIEVRQSLLGQVLSGFLCYRQCQEATYIDSAVNCLVKITKVTLNVDSKRLASVKLQTQCPVCQVTDNSVIDLLQTINAKLDGFGEQLQKDTAEVASLRVDFEALNTAQEETNLKVDAVEAVPAEAKLSAADEAVLLRAACKQVSNQLVVSGLPEVEGEDIKSLSRSLIGALGVTLDEDDLVDALRIGKRRRAAGYRRSGLAGPRTIVVAMRSKDACRKVIDAKKGKRDFNAKQVDQSLPDVKVYVDLRQPAQLHQLKDRVIKAFPRVDQFAVLNVCSLNAQCLMAHFCEFKEFFKVNPYHVIGVVETWLCDAIPDHQVVLPGYVLLRVDRHSKRGGGVAVFVRKELNARLLSSSIGAVDAILPEYLIAEVWGPSQHKILIAIVYRPPKAGYMCTFEDDYIARMVNYKFACVLGDFNADLLFNNDKAVRLRDFFVKTGISIVPLRPTTHTVDANTWIDVCAVSHFAALESWGQSGQPFLSSHDLIYFCLKHKHPKPVRRLVKCLSWKEADFAAAAEMCVPVHEFVAKRSPAPWITQELRDIRRDRDRCYRRFERSGHRKAWEDYVTSRRQAQSLWKKCRASYLQSMFNRAGHTKQFWVEMDRLGLTATSAKSRDVLRFSVEDLNDYYATITEGRKLPSLDEVIAGLARSGGGVLFSFARVDARKVAKCISLGTLRAEGVDGISAHVLKTFKVLFGPLITDLINSSLHSGCYPTLWRSSLITPIPKARSPQTVADMRPISILCAMSKVCERVVLDQIIRFLNDHDVLDRCQTGFRPGMGTQTAVIKFVDEVRCGIDEQLVTLAVFINLTKAFDSVDHLLLLRKLHGLGFAYEVIRWMYFYLSGRRHALRDGDNVSAWRECSTGVPQGSVLGPLLFSLFINDLPKCLRYCSHLFYADDGAIYLTCKLTELNSGIERMNEDLVAVTMWCQRNKLKINAGKTKAMILGSAFNVNSVGLDQIPRLILDDEVNEYVVSFKYLGVMLDPRLSWTGQVAKTCSSASTILYRLRHSVNDLNIPLKRQLVTSLVLPVFDYSTWGAHQRAQAWGDLGWLAPHNRRLYLLGCIYYGMLVMNKNALLCERVRMNHNIARHRDNNRTDTLIAPVPRTSTFQHSFLVLGTSFWNSLPPAITTASSPEVFKTSCYNYLLTIERAEVVSALS